MGPVALPAPAPPAGGEERQWFHCSRELIWYLSLECDVLDFNPSFQATTGWAPDRMLGVHFPDYVREEDRAGFLRAWRGLRQDWAWRLELQLRTGPGSSVRLQILMTRLPGQRRVLCMASDLTESRRQSGELEARLRECQAALDRETEQRRQAEAMKEELLSTVSHELRTPLASVRGFAELLLRRSYPPELQKRFLSIMERESVRLTNLISNFLDVHRMESGRMDYQIQLTPIRPLIEEVAATFAQTAPAHLLRMELPAALPEVAIDMDRMRQALRNLLSNGVKFSPAGAEIRMGAREESGELVLWVADNGVGMTEDVRRKLFQKFFRADSGDTRATGGTGLGLVLVKQIAEAHGGRVWVESDPGAGSTFFLALPAGRGSGGAEAVPQRCADILIVDRKGPRRSALEHHLRGLGLEVECANSLCEVEEAARQHNPRLIAVGAEQEECHLDRWALLDALKSNDSFSAIPVAMIGDWWAGAYGLALHGADYLPKNLLREELCRRIRQMLGTTRGKRILLAEDSAVVRRSVASLVRNECEAEVIETGDGAELVAVCRQTQPDLVLLDLIMPVMNGFEVLRWLRAERSMLPVPVIVLTAKDLMADEKALLQRRLAIGLGGAETTVEQMAAELRRLVKGVAATRQREAEEAL